MSGFPRDLPALGAGLGYRHPFLSDLFLNQKSVDFLEITAEHFLDVPQAKLDELDLLSRHFPLIPHGLNLSLGSAEGLDLAYVAKIQALVERLNPPWWSEHIAHTRTDGIDIGHLSPLPRNREALEVLCRNVAEVRKFIPVPLILENITTVMEFPGNEYSEGEFLAELVERTDCGLLLDVTNLYTNSINFKRDPIQELERIPLDRVVQLHFVGGHWEGDLLIDSHGYPTMPEVWDLLEEVIKRCSVKGAILERDDHIPAYSELASEVARVRALGEKYGRWVSRNSSGC